MSKFLITLMLFPIIVVKSVYAKDESQALPYEILRADDVDVYAKANISDFSWLSGDWQFEADFSGQMMKGYVSVGEIVHGQMLGYSRGWSNDGIIFNEILSYTQRGDSVEFRLKHFSYDLHGWEPVDQPVKHPLLKLAPDVFYFDTHTIVKESEDKYTLYLMTVSTDGRAEYHVIPHVRVK